MGHPLMVHRQTLAAREPPASGKLAGLIIRALD